MFYKCRDSCCGSRIIKYDLINEACPKCDGPVRHVSDICDRLYLMEHSSDVFVFGDNLERSGYGGAAALRDMPNTYGFITKKKPNNLNTSFYTPSEYLPVFEAELEKLENFVIRNIEKRFLISKIGSGLANRYKIWEEVIEDRIIELSRAYPRCLLLWED